jgi:hypothetical protein
MLRSAGRSKVAIRGHPSNTSIYPALSSVEVCHTPIKTGYSIVYHMISRGKYRVIGLRTTRGRSAIFNVSRNVAWYRLSSALGIGRWDKLRVAVQCRSYRGLDHLIRYSALGVVLSSVFSSATFVLSTHFILERCLAPTDLNRKNNHLLKRPESELFFAPSSPPALST